MDKKTNLRATTVTILQNLLNQKGSLASELSLAENLQDNERRLVHELCYGTCRWYFFLEKVAKKFLSKPLKVKDRDIYLLILLGIYQLQFTRIAPYAVINETVNCALILRKPWAKKLVNAVLRNFQRKYGEAGIKISEKEYRQSHPEWLRETIQKQWPDFAATIFSANNDYPPMTLRVNQQYTTAKKYQQILNDLPEPIHATRTPYSPVGLLLESPTVVTQLPYFASGHVSVQDEAAQLSATLLQLEPGQHVLDACSSPGGKTCHILEEQPDIAHLTAIELEQRRLSRLHENIRRLGVKQSNKIEVICNDATQPSLWWDKKPYQRILLDAPCSATGVIRRHPDSKLLRSTKAVEDLAQLQLQLLQSLWPLLDSDGVLLYATCSILPIENTELIEAFVQSRDDIIHDPIEADWGLAQTYGRQLLPQHKGHDGFYYARLKKRIML